MTPRLRSPVRQGLLAVAVGIFAFPATLAAAGQGAVGPVSKGTVSIRASVAQRIYLRSATGDLAQQRNCVAIATNLGEAELRMVSPEGQDRQGSIIRHGDCVLPTTSPVESATLIIAAL